MEKNCDIELGKINIVSSNKTPKLKEYADSFKYLTAHKSHFIFDYTFLGSIESPIMSNSEIIDFYAEKVKHFDNLIVLFRIVYARQSPKRLSLLKERLSKLINKDSAIILLCTTGKNIEKVFGEAISLD